MYSFIRTSGLKLDGARRDMLGACKQLRSQTCARLGALICLRPARLRPTGGFHDEFLTQSVGDGKRAPPSDLVDGTSALLPPTASQAASGVAQRPAQIFHS